MRSRLRGKILGTFFLGGFFVCFFAFVWMLIRGREEGVMEDDSRPRCTAVELMRYDSGDRSDSSDSNDDSEGD